MTKKHFNCIRSFFLNYILIIIWFSIFLSIFILTFSFIFYYINRDISKSFEYSLNLFFGLENPFIFKDFLIIIILGYVLLFFNWSALPIVIIQIFIRKKKAKNEFLNDIEDIFIAREFRKLRIDKGEEAITLEDIKSIYEVVKKKMEKLKV